jgi:Domain of unknown function (DUF4926)
MNFELFSEAILTRDVPEEGLHAGDGGTVVEIYEVAGSETGYSIEFFDALGNTIAVVELPASALRMPTDTEHSS